MDRYGLRFESYSSAEGLSQSIVECLGLDPAGFLWLGTEDGLNRFDGYDFRIFRHAVDDPHSLSYSEIKSLEIDPEGMMWVGTFGGLNLFDPSTERCHRLLHDPDDPTSLSCDIVRSLALAPDGTLWIGTEGGGLDRLDTDVAEPVVFRHHRHHPDDPRSLCGNTVLSLLCDREGRLWIGTDVGLDHLDPDDPDDPESPPVFRHHGWQQPGSRPASVGALLEDREGRLWVGTSRGLARLDSEGSLVPPASMPEALSSHPVSCLAQDPSGHLVVGLDGGGLVIFDPEGPEHSRPRLYRHDPRDPSTLATDRVLSCGFDGAGNLWVGTYGGCGLHKGNPRRACFSHYRCHPDDPLSLSHSIVWSLCQDAEGRLWVGTDDGLDRIDRRRGTIRHIPPEPEDPEGLGHPAARVVRYGASGCLWVGTNGGLHRCAAPGAERLRFERWRHDPGDPSSLAHDEIRSLYEDTEERLWIGTLGGGLCCFDPDTGGFRTYRHDPDDPGSLGSNYIRPIWDDGRGHLWIGTQGAGLDRFDPSTGQATHYRHDPDDPETPSSDHVFAIWPTSDGILWLGTYAGGLDRFDPRSGRVTRFGEADGLPANLIYDLLGDDEGRLWISTNRGLSCFDPATRRFRTWNTSDGLQADEFNGGSCHRAADGELFFGGINGFNGFYPDDLAESRFEPRTVVTDFQLLGSSLRPAQVVDGRIPLKSTAPHARRIVLGPRDRVMSFRFSSLDFTNPGKNRYAYRLVGFDRGWRSTTADQRQATYTNLPPGHYHFEARGSNCDGRFGSEPARIEVVIEPPWWRRGTVRALAAGGTLAVAALTHRRRMERVRLETELAAARYAQRSIWPAEAPHLEGFDIAGSSLPASEVGGDFFDYVWLDEGQRRLALALGDVAGKGMAAAMRAVLCAGMTTAELDRCRPRDVGLEETLDRLNDLICRRRTGRQFTALCLAELDADSLEMQWVDAGLPEPLLWSKGRSQYLPSPDPRLPLGLRAGLHYRQSRCPLDPGDVVILTSDGVPEARNVSGALLGYEGLRGWLDELGPRLVAGDFDARRILDHLLAHLDRFTGGAPPHDDLTVVIVRVTHQTAAGPSSGHGG